MFTFLTKQFIDGLESRSNWKGNSYKYSNYRPNALSAQALSIWRERKAYCDKK